MPELYGHMIVSCDIKPHGVHPWALFVPEVGFQEIVWSHFERSKVHNQRLLQFSIRRRMLHAHYHEALQRFLVFEHLYKGPGLVVNG